MNAYASVFGDCHRDKPLWLSTLGSGLSFIVITKEVKQSHRPQEIASGFRPRNDRLDSLLLFKLHTIRHIWF